MCTHVGCICPASSRNLPFTLAQEGFKMNIRKKVVAAFSALTLSLTLMGSGCQSDADKASENLATAAEQFEVQRKIVGINGITDKPAFEVEGRCSIEIPSDWRRVLEVVCKHGPDDLRKHHLGVSDNVYWVSTQLEGLPVDVFRTRIVIKPENVIPNFDLKTSKTG